MKKLITIMVTGILLFVTRQSIAQSSDASSITIGQKLPDHLRAYINQTVSPQVDLFNGKKKLIILDFWNKSCKAAVTTLPKMESLQKEFDKAIQVIPVTTMTEVEAQNLLREGIRLPGITGDTMLIKSFPHTGVPHHVWVNSEGIVEYITYDENTTSKTISAFLQGKKPKLSHKIELGAMESSKPLWAKENDPLGEHIKYYSYVSGWIKDYRGGNTTKFLDSVHGSIGIRYYNQSLLSLYKIAYGANDKDLFEDMKRVVIDPSAKTLQKSEADDDPDEWERQNLICYEISIPIRRKHELYAIMQQDLNRYFDYEVQVETRPVQSLCLVRLSKIDKISSQSTNPKKTIYADTLLDLSNASLKYGLLERLRTANARLSAPILDLTGFAGKVTMRLNCSLTDIPALRQELRKYDLDLVKRTVPLKMLVIKKKIPAMKP